MTIQGPAENEMAKIRTSASRAAKTTLPQESAKRIASTSSFSPKRGRPTADQANAISRAILDAAAEVFLAKGFEAASMDAIAETAGVPRSTLYNRYPSKFAVIQAVARDRVKQWEAAGIQGYAPLSEDFETRLKQHAEQVLYGANSDDVRAFMRLTVGPWEGASEIRRILNTIGYDAMVAFLEREFRTFAGTGGPKPRNLRTVAEALMAMLSGWVAARQDDAAVPREDAQGFAHAAVELLLHGRSAW